MPASTNGNAQMSIGAKKSRNILKLKGNIRKNINDISINASGPIAKKKAIAAITVTAILSALFRHSSTPRTA